MDKEEKENLEKTIREDISENGIEQYRPIIDGVLAYKKVLDIHKKSGNKTSIGILSGLIDYDALSVTLKVVSDVEPDPLRNQGTRDLAQYWIENREMINKVLYNGKPI